MSKCLVIGSSVCDCLIYTDVLPSREGDAHISNQKMQIGGCALNVAATLKGLGADFDLLSPVGQGIYGDFVASELAKLQLPIFRVEGENGCCYCFIEADGERTFLSYHGVEYSFQRSWLANFDLNDYAYLYLCGLEVEEETGEELVDALADFKGTIVFCPGPRVCEIPLERIAQLLSYQPLLHLNEQEVYLMSGQRELFAAIESLYAKTHAPVVVTLGSKGVIAYDGEWAECVSEKVEVKDTVGAGDSHVAGMLAGLLADYNLRESLQLANRVAGAVVQVSGALLPKEKYLELRLNET